MYWAGVWREEFLCVEMLREECHCVGVLREECHCDGVAVRSVNVREC